ncbi:hypothetical protein HELRODRAFT_163544 [Helobdella robusta]|uniref:Uncharacterized protein n=1 Tax=Helobdella robusta TaxID=6412 RepID=T1EU66_HELRO|nr:hypothetical protein HELRODRAFT_163544 [Helobdella robusta]ESN96477.1 hypothetical protein HELRODRAFT_163544 [Helobdella robusta]
MSRMPTYYTWDMNDPLTTNQTYGHSLDAISSQDGDATSNLNSDRRSKLLQQLNASKNASKKNKSALVAMEPPPFIFTSEATSLRKKSSKAVNVDYVAGRVNIVDKMAATVLFNEKTREEDVKLREERKKKKEIYLWHSMTGCLVHYKQ